MPGILVVVLGQRRMPGTSPGRKRELRDLLRRSIDCLRLGACVAGLSDDFLAALLEAVPIVGSVIPGSTIILALSALGPGGELDLVGVFTAAIAGAALGDGTAFWIGHRAQREILSAWPMSRYPELIAQSEAFFHRWGRSRYSSRASCRRSAPSYRYRGRAGDVAAALLRGQYRGDPAVGAGAYPARRARGIGAGTGRRDWPGLKARRNITGYRWCSALH